MDIRFWPNLLQIFFIYFQICVHFKILKFEYCNYNKDLKGPRMEPLKSVNCSTHLKFSIEADV